MKITIHKSETRGLGKTDWLTSYHTFSFADYFCPERIHFGALRVLNDDYILPLMGFGMHPHENMEIITIPLKGKLLHKDSRKNEEVIQYGQVQRMSAGKGIRHSEFNASQTETLNLLQIWIIPDQKGIEPRYETKLFPFESLKNDVILLASANGNNNSFEIQQKAQVLYGKYDKNTQFTLKPAYNNNGVYIFIVSGSLKIADKILLSRDGAGLENFEETTIDFIEDSEFVIFEVPMIK